MGCGQNDQVGYARELTLQDLSSQSPPVRFASPVEWGKSFPAPPDLCSTSGNWRGALLRRWSGTSPAMEQPNLDHHYLALHLGGAKHVTRRRDGPTLDVDAKFASITSVTAGAAHSWYTKGPIGFAHLYIDPAAIGRMIQEHFDRDPRRVELTDCVAVEAPLIRALMLAMLAEVDAPSSVSRMKLDILLQTVLVQLICDHSTLVTTMPGAPHSLAPSRLRRVLDFIEAHLSDQIELDDLAAVAGSSRFHFAHAFRDATGFPPYRYLVHRRIDAAKTLLLQNNLSMKQISARSGFKSSAQFAVMFKQMFGTTPSRFRREH